MNNDLKITDLELVEKVMAGDKRSYSMLVRRHQQGLIRLCLRFVKDMDVARDVVQDSFIKAYERLSSFEGRASFKSWLYQIAVNTAKNKLRDRRGEMKDLDDVQLGVAAQAESGLVHQAVSHLIAKHVEELPFKQRTALTLRIYEDLSFKEIAEIMECPYDTAKANYRHALLKLREELSGEEDLKNWSEEVGGFFMEWNQKVAEAEA
jgi:RNA polymerase sigma-70 factor (ECF subfamily)